MASATAEHGAAEDADVAAGTGTQRRSVDWATVMTSAALALVPFVAILVSLFILHGQTTARIDATRTELAASIEATNTRIDATNDRIDDVLLLLAGLGDVAADIEAMRADVAKLAED